MFDYMKTIISGVKSWVSEELGKLQQLVGAAQATADEAKAAAVQPDWSQNDETAVDYVKGRTHYKEIGYLAEWDWAELGDSTGAVKISDTVITNWEDLVGLVVEQTDDYGTSKTTITSDMIGYRLNFLTVFTSYYQDTWWFRFTTDGIYYLRPYGRTGTGELKKETISKLDEEYLPDSVPTGIKAAQSTADAATTAAATAQSTADLAKIAAYNTLAEFAPRAFAGTVWTKVDSDRGVSAYAGGLWISGGSYNSRKGLYYSTDGITWTQSNITSGFFTVIVYADGLWVAGGSRMLDTVGYGLYYSTDGMTWTQSNITSGPFAVIVYADGLWVAGSGYSKKGLYYSTDGMTWTQSNITSSDIGAVAYGDGLWVAGDNTGLYYSTDGMTWTQSNITSGYVFDSIIYCDGLWVVGSNTYFYYSEDGKTWTRSNIVLGDVNYANGVWVANYFTDGFCYSVDGIAWTRSNITSGYSSGFVYADGIWVASGDGADLKGLWYSIDGKTWAQSNVTSGSFQPICFGGGLWRTGSYCSVHKSSLILSSSTSGSSKQFKITVDDTGALSAEEVT